MHTLTLKMPSKRFGLYVALSLICHAILLSLWQAPPPRAPIFPAPSAIVFDVASPIQEKPSLPSPPEAQTSPKAAVHATIPVAPQTETGAHPEPTSEGPPPQSIMFTHREKPADALGISRALPGFGSSGADTSGGALKRLADMVRKYRQPLKPSKPQNEWIPALGLATREGTAFYAAYAAHNVPAMLAVTGLSLTRGSIRKGIDKTVSAIKGIGQDDPEMQGNDVFLLAHIAQNAPVTARDLYMTMPPGWTYVTLKKKLDKLTKQGKLTRYGRGHKAVYHTD